MPIKLMNSSLKPVRLICSLANPRDALGPDDIWLCSVLQIFYPSGDPQVLRSTVEGRV